MARPPVEWPIPVYVVELRERIVAAFRVPPPLLAFRVPAPLAPEPALGGAVVALCLGNGRCLKPAAGERVLASEFRAAELVAPVRWQAACRPPQRGLFLLDLFTDSCGLERLLRTTLQFEARRARQVQGAAGKEYACRIEADGGGARLALPRPVTEAPWPSGSVYPSAEAAEVALAHPQAYFIPHRDGEAVRAAFVHQYARTTIHVRPALLAAPLVAAALGARPGEVEPDHVWYQKRCTHTWFFPPERIPLARPLPGARLERDREAPLRLAA
jgi:hypothetical protein